VTIFRHRSPAHGLVRHRSRAPLRQRTGCRYGAASALCACRRSVASPCRPSVMPPGAPPAVSPTEHVLFVCWRAAPLPPAHHPVQRTRARQPASAAAADRISPAWAVAVARTDVAARRKEGARDVVDVLEPVRAELDAAVPPAERSALGTSTAPFRRYSPASARRTSRRRRTRP
jgi:hypothetical protein